MRNRFTLILLTMMFLLSTTASLVAHDHGFTVSGKGYDCTSDHNNDQASPTHPEAELQKSGRGHHHDCLGCQLGGHRSLIATPRGAEVGQIPTPAALQTGSEAPAVSKLPTSRTLRGPPRA